MVISLSKEEDFERLKQSSVLVQVEEIFDSVKEKQQVEVQLENQVSTKVKCTVLLKIDNEKRQKTLHLVIG